MAVSVTCRFCEATIRPPGGRAEAVTHCPWCAKDLRPDPPAPPPRPVPAPPAPRAGLTEPVVAALVLAASAVAAVGAFFAARWLVAAAG